VVHRLYMKHHIYLVKFYILNETFFISLYIRLNRINNLFLCLLAKITVLHLFFISVTKETEWSCR